MLAELIILSYLNLFDVFCTVLNVVGFDELMLNLSLFAVGEKSYP